MPSAATPAKPIWVGHVMWDRMTHTKVNYADVDEVGDGMHFLRDPLDCDHLGLTILDCDQGWTGSEHDHAADGQEEVYLLVDGAATVTVDGTPVEMTSGDALRVAPDASRQIRTDADSTFVLAGAP